jgi:8-oxo-dGTP pyrophosphatase MutT (NUDIX family)
MAKHAEHGPCVGVAVLVFRGVNVLVGKNFTKGRGHFFGFPGGSLKSRESLAEAAKREVFEKAGIRIGNLRLASVHDFFIKGKRRGFVTIGFSADYKSGRPRKCWGWFDINKLPEPMLKPDGVLVGHAKSEVFWKDATQ